MCHPHTRVLNILGREAGQGDVVDRWKGAFNVYDNLRSFVFGQLDDDDDRTDGHDVLNSLYADGQLLHHAILEFIARVQARTMIDMACRHETHLKWKWTLTLPESYHPWHALEDECLRRENLDLYYVGSVPREYSTSYFVLLMCMRFIYLCRISIHLLLFASMLFTCRYEKGLPGRGCC